LDLPLQSIDDQHLKERLFLKSDSVSTYNDVKVQIIIGVDHIKISVPFKVRKAAVQCKLERTLYGCHGSEDVTSCTAYLPAQKFLWRNEEIDRQPKIFVTRVMPFGAACSLLPTNFILHKI